MFANIFVYTYERAYYLSEVVYTSVIALHVDATSAQPGQTAYARPRLSVPHTCKIAPKSLVQGVNMTSRRKGPLPNLRLQPWTECEKMQKNGTIH